MSEQTEVKAKTDIKRDANEIVTMRQLLECGVHFGHQTKRWNAKMKPFIFTARNGIHVIDLQQTLKLIKQNYELLRGVAAKGGTVLFVGTKKQAQEAIELEAKRCGMPFVNHRWLGGTLTNNVTIRQSIGKLKKYQNMETEGTLDHLSNKEASKIKKKMVKLEYYLGGIRDMVSMPSVIFVIDTNREQLAIKEAHRLNIPIIGIVDTNANPNEVDYPIPANDDAIRAIKLLVSIFSQAMIDGMQDRQGKNTMADVEAKMAQTPAAPKAPAAKAPVAKAPAAAVKSPAAPAATPTKVGA